MAVIYGTLGSLHEAIGQLMAQYDAGVPVATRGCDVHGDHNGTVDFGIVMTVRDTPVGSDFIVPEADDSSTRKVILFS